MLRHLHFLLLFIPAAPLFESVYANGNVGERKQESLFRRHTGEISTEDSVWESDVHDLDPELSDQSNVQAALPQAPRRVPPPGSPPTYLPPPPKSQTVAAVPRAPPSVQKVHLNASLWRNGSAPDLRFFPRSGACGSRNCLSCAHPVSDEPTGVDVAFQGEFGYEMIAVVPFAYFHFLNGTLRSTLACGSCSMDLFYYFSPRHISDPSCRRTFQESVRRFGFTLGLHHSPIPDAWHPPPYRYHFQEWGKVWPQVQAGMPLVVICNKHEWEWGLPPINFIPVATVMRLIAQFDKAGFRVVYNRPGMFVERDAWQHVPDKYYFNDTESIEAAYPGRTLGGSRVLLIHDILRANPDLTYNEVQLRLYARSRCFITVQGGGSILASYFGGHNIIYFKRGRELKGGVYERVYPRLGGGEIDVVHSEESLLARGAFMILRGKCEAD